MKLPLRKEQIHSDHQAKNPIAAWIQSGYKEFGDVGPTRLNIKNIALRAKVPRTSFYYIFKSRDEFISELLSKHETLYQQFNASLISATRPQELFSQNPFYKEILRFHRQLLLNCHIPEYKAAYERQYPSIEKAFELKISRLFNKKGRELFQGDDFHTFIDLFFSRIDINDLSWISLSEQADKIFNKINEIF